MRPIVKCLVQPGDGVMPLIKGINEAKKSVEVVIFRFNRSEIEKALAAAVTRGVHVHALIAYTNRGGEQRLRDLEMRLLGVGVITTNTKHVEQAVKLFAADTKRQPYTAGSTTFIVSPANARRQLTAFI